LEAIGIPASIYTRWKDAAMAGKALREQEKKLANAMGLPLNAGTEREQLRRKLQRVFETRNPEARAALLRSEENLARLEGQVMALGYEEAFGLGLTEAETEAWRSPADVERDLAPRRAVAAALRQDREALEGELRRDQEAALALPSGPVRELALRDVREKADPELRGVRIEAEAAAMGTMKAVMRGKRARRGVGEMADAEGEEATTRIQSGFRGRQARAFAQQKRSDTRNEASATLQAGVVGRTARGEARRLTALEKAQLAEEARRVHVHREMERERSAQVILSGVQGRAVRREAAWRQEEVEREAGAAAATVQGVLAGRRGRQDANVMQLQALAEREASTSRIQAGMRGRTTRGACRVTPADDDAMDDETFATIWGEESVLSPPSRRGQGGGTPSSGTCLLSPVEIRSCQEPDMLYHDQEWVQEERRRALQGGGRSPWVDLLQISGSAALSLRLADSQRHANARGGAVTMDLD